MDTDTASEDDSQVYSSRESLPLSTPGISPEWDGDKPERISTQEDDEICHLNQKIIDRSTFKQAKPLNDTVPHVISGSSQASNNLSRSSSLSRSAAPSPPHLTEFNDEQQDNTGMNEFWGQPPQGSRCYPWDTIITTNNSHDDRSIFTKTMG